MCSRVASDVCQILFTMRLSVYTLSGLLDFKIRFPGMGLHFGGDPGLAPNI